MNKIIALNWKNYATKTHIDSFINAFGTKPYYWFLPYTHLDYAISKSHDCTIGAQDISAFTKTVTGEIDANLLTDLNISTVLLNHFERLTWLKEQALLEQKLQMAQNMQKIFVCIGETKQNTLKDMQKELVNLAKLIARYGLDKKIVIAYEPCWAIGGTSLVNPSQLASSIKFMQKLFMHMPVIYGGSVTSQNIKEFLNIADGVLIGSASKDLNEFAKMHLFC